MLRQFLRGVEIEHLPIEPARALGARALLVETRPPPRGFRPLGVLVELPVLRRVELRPKVLSQLAAERIVFALAFGLYVEDFPVEPVATTHHPRLTLVALRQDGASQIQLGPTRHDERHPRAGQQSGEQIVLVRVQRFLAYVLGVRFLAPGNRVVDYSARRAITCQAAQQAHAEHLALVGERPLLRGIAHQRRGLVP